MTAAPASAPGAQAEEQRFGTWHPDVVTWLTIYVVILFGVPSRLVVGPLGSAGALSMLLGLVSLGVWILHRIGASRPIGSTIDPIVVTLGLFLASVGLSYARAMSRPIMPDEISPADVALLSLLSWTGVVLLAREIPTRQRLDALVRRLCVAGAALAVLGMAQFLTRSALVDVISVPGLTAMWEAEVFFRDGRVRPSGTSIHPLEYGAILSMLLPMALNLAFNDRDRPLVARWLPAILIGGMIAVSSSRTAYLTALLGVAIAMVAWSWRQRLILLGIASAGVFTLVGMAPRLIGSMLNLFSGAREDPSIESRTDSFSVAWHFLKQDPLLGRGLGTFLGKYRIFDNQFLLLLVSVGILGTVLFVGILGVTILRALRVCHSAGDLQTKALASSLAGSVAAGALSLAFFDAFAFPMTMGALFLTAGITSSLARLTTGEAAAHGCRYAGVRMTVWDLLRAALRRWVVVAVCILLTGAAGLLAIRDTGVYFARMEVVLLAPRTWYRNTLQGGTEGTVMTAGAVARRMTGAGREIKFGSVEATLVGISDQKEGYWVRAEDRGGQWNSDFRQPIIVVDVIEASPAQVRALQFELIERIQDELDDLQDELRVDEEEAITLNVAPELSVIYNVRGNRIRALGMTLALGAGATVTIVWVLERGIVRMPRRRVSMASGAAEEKGGETSEEISPP